MKRKEIPKEPPKRKPRFGKPESEVILLPAREVRLKEAAEKIGSILGKKVTETELLFLNFPEKPKMALLPGGVEFYDQESRRPSVPREGESMDDLLGWVAHFYFSVHKRDGMMLGRLIYLDHPVSRRIIQREIDQKDPQAGMNRFIASAMAGEPLG